MIIEGILYFIEKMTHKTHGLCFTIRLGSKKFGLYDKDIGIVESLNKHYYKLIDNNLFYINNEEYVYNSSNLLVKCKSSFEDGLKLIDVGGNALVYNDLNSKYILKVNYINNVGNEDIIPELFNYCLFYESVRVEKMYHIYKFKKVETTRALKFIHRKTSDMNMFIAFRNLFEGIIRMKQLRIFNGDIKHDNVGYDGEKFVFIDLEYMESYDKCKDMRCLRWININIPIGLDKSTLLFVDSEVVNRYNDIDYMSYRYYFENQFLGKYINVLNSNFNSETQHELNELIFDYISVYRTVIILCTFIKYLDIRTTATMDQFIYRCLDYNKHGFITSEECLELYEQLLF